MRQVLMTLTMMLAAASAEGANLVVDFDDLPAGPTVYAGPGGGAYWNGSDGSGSFTSHGVSFPNFYDDTFGPYWEAFAYSNTSDTTTAGFGNQYSAFSGTGVGPGADNYGVGFTGGFSLAPVIDLPAGFSIQGLYVTNITYAATSMRDGDGFAKKFGGASGDDEDWFKLTVTGLDSASAPIGTVDFYLADYRFSDNAQDYIVDEWTALDLSSLAPAARLAFSLSSSDVGTFGMNTPAYFALDDIELVPESVPEPATVVLMGLGAAMLGVCAWVKDQKRK